MGVSPQAVSKWENGGVPDTELLPKIADFFEIPVDFLFGRNIKDYKTFSSVLMEKISEAPIEQSFKSVFNYCWDMERALCGAANPKDGSVEDYEKELDKQEQRYSSIISDYGFTRMGIANRLQYFLLVPENTDTETAFFDGVDYSAFLKDFSDKDVFNACVMLNKRSSEKAFSSSLLEKNLKMKSEKAEQVIGILEKYNLLKQTQIETDDNTLIVYKFMPTPSFIAFLIFAREMIKPPGNFSYYCAGRNKPFFE